MGNVSKNTNLSGSKIVSVENKRIKIKYSCKRDTVYASSAFYFDNKLSFNVNLFHIYDLHGPDCTDLILGKKIIRERGHVPEHP